MTQIRMEDLWGALRRLNGQTKRKYNIDGAYGGWKLTVQEQGSSINDISFGYDTKSNIYYIIQSINRLLEAERHEPQ